MKFKFLMASILLFTTMLSAQTMNQEIKIENKTPFLVGSINLEGLNSNHYKDWFRKNHDTYIVDRKTIDSFKESLSKYHILVFLGTWCGDSKRETPRFIKILETADFSFENLKIVALDGRKEHYKKSPTGEEWGLQIKKVPTFIFLKDGKEMGRIVESPIESIEKDIRAIVEQKSYVPNYADLMKSE